METEDFEHFSHVLICPSCFQFVAMCRQAKLLLLGNTHVNIWYVERTEVLAQFITLCRTISHVALGWESGNSAWLCLRLLV